MNSADKPIETPDPAPELPRETTSDAYTGLRLHEPKKVAGGIPAVVSSMKHVIGEAGMVRGGIALQALNQKGGIDCPGCAWPDPDGHRSHSEFCENGAKAIAEEATTKRIGPEFFARYSVEELARESDHWLGKAGRLTHPMLLREGATHYEPISWDEAFAICAEEMNAVTPDECIFYTSGRTSNEAAFLYQLFVRMLGTNNLPDCSNMCHESSGAALGYTLGVGKGTVHLDDFEKADLILIIGQNPGTNHPRMLSTLQAAVRAGATLVSVNPLRETGTSRFIHPQEPLSLLGQGTALASIHIPVRTNGDCAFFKGVMKVMLEAVEAPQSTVEFDRTFIAQHTQNFEELCAHLRDVNFEELEENSGIARAEMERIAELCLKSRATIACWAMGLTQHKNSVATIREVVNLLLLGGHVGKDGAGVCPVRGHSNVQGDRTMGIWEKMPDAWLDRLGNEFGFAPPRHEGFDTVAAIKAMLDGRGKVFFAMGGNFLSATPDTKATARALRNCALTVHVSTKLNRAHLVTGKRALILPCLGRTERDIQNGVEQFVTVENSMGVVHASRGKLKPASEHLLSEPRIVARLAQATLKNSGVDWNTLANDYNLIRDHIERVIPGFEKFNARANEGFYLPNSARERTWKTPTGKANFSVNETSQIKLEDGQFVMMTIRSHDQYNTTIYGLDDRYRGIENERRVVFVNVEDMAEHGVKSGDEVDLISHFAGEERVAPKFLVVPYEIPRRCVATYFPEANVLVPLGSVADDSHTPTSKSVIISLRKY